MADINTDETPFTLSRVVCPVCRTVNEFECLKAGAYTESGADTDFRPLGRRWTNPRYQWVHPLLHFMATCTTCFYSRESSRLGSGEEWTQDQTRVVRQRHLAALAAENSVIRRLGEGLWAESFPLATAINKILLGIIDEQLSDNPSDNKLARWYVRVGWLFREMNEDAGEGASPRRHHRRDLLLALDDIKQDLSRVDERVLSLVRFVESHPDAAQQHPDDADSPDEFRRMLAQVSKDSAQLVKAVQQLVDLLAVDHGTVVGSDAVSGRAEAFGDSLSYADFLRSLKVDLAAIPTSESDALEHALLHYRRLADSEEAPCSRNGRIMTLYMIGELSRRLGKSEDAANYMAQARTAAAEVIETSGRERTHSALARHIATMAEQQMRRLWETPTPSWNS